jgi:hypothetical protein
LVVPAQADARTKADTGMRFMAVPKETVHAGIGSHPEKLVILSQEGERNQESGE